MKNLLLLLYNKLVFDRPWLMVVLISLLCLAAAWQAQEFRLDASADSLVLEQDEDLRYFREIIQRYSAEDFLFVAYVPKTDLYADETLADIKSLRDELANLNLVSSVISILDVPLLHSPEVPLSELASNVQSLEKPTVDKELAKVELPNSPIYRNLVVSPDNKVTALQVNLQADQTYIRLLQNRTQLREKSTFEGLSEEEKTKLEQASEELRQYAVHYTQARHELIQQVRSVMDTHRDKAELYLGGVSMIADDMISFVENDIRIFGSGVFLFLVAMLSIIFRRLRWVLLPLLTCAVTVLLMIGALGVLHWPVTVVSSNFISLLLIITMSMTIHLIVRYRQLLGQRPDAPSVELVRDAVITMFRPCFFAAITTIAAFISLLLSGIRPIIDFGWIMTIGITIGFLVVFLLFPAILLFFKVDSTTADTNTSSGFTLWFARFTEKQGTGILIFSLLVALFSGWGISKLAVENSFIDYFKESTEIYQGMALIDQQLGGTTPLDLIFTFPADPAEEKTGTAANDDLEDEDWGDDEYADDENESAEEQAKYWFTQEKMALLKKIHAYLDNLPETGKVLSMATMMEIAEEFTDGEPLDNLQLALLYSQIPKEFRATVIDPYVNIAHNEARFTMRIRDSEKGLQRNEMLHRIKQNLAEQLGLPENQFRLTNMMVLYNNMLQSLFRSQILTIGAVFTGIMLMFLVLFRSLNLAVIAIIPNLLSAAFVMGIMGWAGIPLDMMTITIASITIGIAVDDTVHYIVCFREEFAVDRDYKKTMFRCHGTIGKAMYYTSVTIIVGFMILVFSNFYPTIYFGLLTALAMCVAILAALTLLPQLILVFKPLGKEGLEHAPN